MSAILQHAHRPWTVFDPNNADHRRCYSDFLKFRTWSRCPYRFYVPEQASGDLLLMIHDKLARWYTQQEFGAETSVKSSS